MPDALRIQCPQCRTRLKVKDAALLGKSFRCPKCSAKFVAEVPPAEPEDEFLGNLESLGIDHGTPAETYRPAPAMKQKTPRPTQSSDVEERPKKKRRKKSRSSGEGFPTFTWPVFGLLGGMFGGAVWVIVAYLAHLQVGYIAWFTGLLVGFGVRIAAGERDGWAPGLTAAGTALFVVLVSKLIVAYLLFQSLVGDGLNGEINERAMVLKIAHEVAEEFNEKQIAVVWPRGILADEAKEPDDFPDEIWEEAQARWNAKSPDEQQAELDSAERNLNAFNGFAVGIIFLATFRFTDLLWIPLAIFTAFKIGSGATD